MSKNAQASIFPRGNSTSVTLLSLTLLLLLTSHFFSSADAVVRPCEIYDDGRSFKCIKEISGNNGDNFGRVGIINRSSCPAIRFVKQEWNTACGKPSENSPAPTLHRVFSGEVLKYGDFMQDMIQDFITLNACGELRILQCRCGTQLVKCPDVLYVATYKRGEHHTLLEKFKASQMAKYNMEPMASSPPSRCCRG